MPFYWRGAILLALVSASPHPARADDGAAYAPRGPFFGDWRSGLWEFGIDTGVIYPTQKNSFSHVIDDQRAIDVLGSEPVADEVAEGWSAPPAPGSSIVAGTIRPIVDIQAHLFRQVSPWLALGVEGGYGLKRGLRIDNNGIYVPQNFLTLAYTTNFIHLAAPVKVGKLSGRFRPYLIAGPGVYIVQERASIDFKDPLDDDPQIRALEIVHHDATYFGLQGGAGMEWLIGDKGLIGLDCAYHKLFSGQNDHVNFIMPRFRLSAFF